MENIINWFKSLGLKIQIALIAGTGLVLGLVFLYIRSNFRIKQDLKYKLERVKKETELVQLEKDGDAKLQKLKELKEQEEEILEKIKYLEEKEVQGELVSYDELEDFFKKRGL